LRNKEPARGSACDVLVPQVGHARGVLPRIVCSRKVSNDLLGVFDINFQHSFPVIQVQHVVDAMSGANDPLKDGICLETLQQFVLALILVDTFQIRVCTPVAARIDVNSLAHSNCHCCTVVRVMGVRDITQEFIHAALCMLDVDEYNIVPRDGPIAQQFLYDGEEFGEFVIVNFLRLEDRLDSIIKHVNKVFWYDKRNRGVLLWANPWDLD